MDKNKTNYVIYHGNCCDGFASAYSIWKYFKLNNENHLKNIIFYPAKYNTCPPNVHNKNVVICDFSYNEKLLLNMIEQADSLVILDHHKSAENELKNIPSFTEKINKIFRMDQSGAVITWNYFFPNTPVPKFIKYIEDRDIWKKEMKYSDEFNMGFHTIPMKFEEYDKYIDEKNINILIEKGKILLEYNNSLIKQICKHAIVKSSLIDKKVYKIAYVQSNILKSDIGNYLVKKVFPGCDFSVVYNYDDLYKYTKFSLRSTNDKTDVSIIAKLFNGGGHRNASGITINGNLCYLPSKII
jgi:oligoribonuclease NrnB/cAMP/cGMP phosphodiesterase (DHH superfamily)